MKKGDLRRVQILDAAEKLFFEKGYAQTSVQDILDALSISKGGFYHYFDAKADILKEICERRLMKHFERLNADLYSGRKNAIDRMDTLLRLMNVFETEDTDFAALLVKVAYIDEDFTIRACLRRLALEQLLPYINDILAEGIADGCFFTRYPERLGGLLLALSWDADDAVCACMARSMEDEDVLIEVMGILDAYRDSIEQLCGAPTGSLTLFSVEEMLAVFRAAMVNIRIIQEQEDKVK